MSSSIWQCPICKLPNPIQFPECEGCGKTKPEVAAKSGGASLEPPLIKRYTPDTSSKNWKSSQYIAGVATEAESESMEKLYQKFKEIDTMKNLIQHNINDVDKDYVASKQELNDSFDSMISLLEQRRQTLLTNMAEKVTIYKKDLHSKLQQTIADRKELSEVKKQYESNVNNKELTDIEKREKQNVKMIANALQKNEIKSKLKPKRPMFSIQQTETNKMLRNLGEYILKRDPPEAPTVAVLVRTSENAVIEVLLDQNVDEMVGKYELNIYKGSLEEKEWLNVKDNEYLVVHCDAIRDDNICFYTIQELDDNEWYNIRLRAILKEDNIEGLHSEWLQFKTRPLGSDDEDDTKDVISFTNEDEKKMEEAWDRNMKDESLKNRGISHFESWLEIFKTVDLGLSVYQQKRLFFCMQHVEQGPGSMVDSGDFANFVLSVGQRFDSKQWKNICKTIRERILSQ